MTPTCSASLREMSEKDETAAAHDHTIRFALGIDEADNGSMTARASATHERLLSGHWGRWRNRAGDNGGRGPRPADGASRRWSYTPVVSECVNELAVIAEHRSDRARFLDGLMPGRRSAC